MEVTENCMLQIATYTRLHTLNPWNFVNSTWKQLPLKMGITLYYEWGHQVELSADY